MCGKMTPMLCRDDSETVPLPAVVLQSPAPHVQVSADLPSSLCPTHQRHRLCAVLLNTDESLHYGRLQSHTAVLL